jgi:hypothetical protein
MNDMAEGAHGGLPQRRSGWFAMVIAVGVILIVLGVWNAVDGLSALVAGDFVVADADRVVALQVGAIRITPTATTIANQPDRPCGRPP